MRLFSSTDGRWHLEKVPGMIFRLVRRLVRGVPTVKNFYEKRKSEPNEAKFQNDNFRRLGNSQPVTSGVGPMFRRKYWLAFESPRFKATHLMERVKKDLNRFVEQDLAVYKKTKGDPGFFCIGDEYFIEMTGPWNGPVRVLKSTPTSFIFQTLKGHMEAGQIRFRISEEQPSGRLRFEIESRARSRDEGVDVAYDKTKLAQVVQTEMWTSFLENVAEFAGAGLLDKVQVRVKKIETDSHPSATLSLW